MQIGDMVFVRQTIVKDGSVDSYWLLGLITDNKHYQAGLYKVHVFEFEADMKYFIADLRLAEDGQNEEMVL